MSPSRRTRAWDREFSLCCTLLRVALCCTLLHFIKHAGKSIKSRFVALLHPNRLFSHSAVLAPRSFPFLTVSQFEQHPNDHLASVCQSVTIRTASVPRGAPHAALRAAAECEKKTAESAPPDGVRLAESRDVPESSIISTL